jgi:2-oxoglutarate ferredoxin oxidoreductase subunit gamma
MQTEIVIAGFGGQGVLFAGQVLAYAGMDFGLHVTWIPSYGPEMRGGTANCTVIIADEEIGAPISAHPHAVIALNRPSLDRYESLIIPGGILIFNRSLVERDVERADLRVAAIRANEIAEEIGDKRLTNMVMIGGLIDSLSVLPMDVIKSALKAHLPARHQKLLPANYEALDQGATQAREILNTGVIS